jgi:CheY-like chemotaxis protein
MAKYMSQIFRCRGIVVSIPGGQKMVWLREFKSKGFVEQVGELTAISNEKNVAAIPDLFSLYGSPTGDKPVDAMVEHTLRDLLNENEKETVAKITSGTKKEKKLCLHISGVQKFSSAESTLVELVNKEQDIEILKIAFITMSEIRAPRFLKIFRAHVKNPDEIIAAISIGMIGVYKDEQSVYMLKELIEKAENRLNYKSCSLLTGNAIEAAAAVGQDSVTAYFTAKIHHKNPTARRMIHEALVDMGESILPYLGDVFSGEDIDRQIMAANIIGRLGVRNGGNLLVAALDLKGARHPNVRFAIYEALGTIDFSKGLFTLVEGLSEEEDLTLRAVVTSLENRFNPHIVKSIKERITAGDTQSSKLVYTIAAVKALRIFEALYNTGDPIAEKLTAVLLDSRDSEIIDIFIKKLESMGGDRAQADLRKLSDHLKEENKAKETYVLAVDDSPSMLSFYRSLCTDLDLGVSTAENGKEAWDKLESSGGNHFHLLIVDMNMPVMDGVELTGKIRASDVHKELPIIMGTTESDKSQVRLAKKSGVNEFIIKPIQPVILEKKIRKLLKH